MKYDYETWSATRLRVYLMLHVPADSTQEQRDFIGSMLRRAPLYRLISIAQELHPAEQPVSE